MLDINWITDTETYRYAYNESTDRYTVITWNSNIDTWIRQQDCTLWSYEYDDNPSYFHTIYDISPLLMITLKLRWN